MSRKRKRDSVYLFLTIAELSLECFRIFIVAPIAQLDRALDYESRGRGFESSWA